MEYILQFWDCYFFVYFLFKKIHIYLEKSAHISHNIPESQDTIHNIRRVKDSERNKTNPIVLASKLWDL